MPTSALTGSRIRERRQMMEIRQAELAKRAGISPSYLNLIEHNRRKIGGKLLTDIAAELAVDPAALTDGAEAALTATLREAASSAAGAGGGRQGASAPAAATGTARAGIQVPTGAGVLPELARVDEFAGRFPGWAGLTADLSRRVASLERTVETLTDRLTHDPFLSEALHDILTTVTAVRSTSDILVSTPELEPEWRTRFHRNVNEDSQRLAQAAKALVDYLDGVDDIDASTTSPQEELAAFLSARGFHFPALEEDPAADPAGLLEAPELASAAARALAAAHLASYAEDVRRMPLDRVAQALDAHGLDLMALADRLEVPLPALFRRLAGLPADLTGTDVGLATCDASGTLIFRKPLDGFPLPRFGAACPLWPLFQALTQPTVPIRAEISQAGRGEGVFSAFAVASPAGRAGFDAPPQFISSMLLLPAPAQARAQADGVRPVGVGCRICPRAECSARREPSILSQRF